jgi:hypothetical protein
MATAVPGTAGANTGGSSVAQLRAANMAARQLIVNQAIDLTLPIAQGTLSYASGTPTVLNIPVRPVGLVKRFWIEISGIFNSTAGTMTRTPIGMPNLLSSVVFTDLSNQVRVSTTGWHLHYLATVRRQLALGAAFVSTDTAGIGNNWGSPAAIVSGDQGLMNSPITFTQTATPFRWFWEVPISYSDTDLTGAVWANTINAQCNLQIVLNPSFFVVTASDPTLAGFISSAALATNIPTITSINYTIYQNCLDQLPVNPQTNNVVLPVLDLEYAYLLLNTNVNNLSANQNQAIPYANWRSFLSTFLLWDNFGYATKPVGSDVTSIALQTANFTNTFQLDPYIVALLTRTKINADLPASMTGQTMNGGLVGGPSGNTPVGTVGASSNTGITMYYIDTRNKPVNTVQYGNMQLLFQPSTVQGTSSQLLIGYESLALQGAMQQAGSIYQV